MKNIKNSFYNIEKDHFPRHCIPAETTGKSDISSPPFCYLKESIEAQSLEKNDENQKFFQDEVIEGFEDVFMRARELSKKTVDSTKIPLKIDGPSQLIKCSTDFSHKTISSIGKIIDKIFQEGNDGSEFNKDIQDDSINIIELYYRNVYMQSIVSRFLSEYHKSKAFKPDPGSLIQEIFIKEMNNFDSIEFYDENGIERDIILKERELINFED